MYRQDLSRRLTAGNLDADGLKESRRVRKQELTGLSSSRWAGAITRAAEDQYRLGMRALTDEVRSLRAGVGTIDKRLAAPAGTRAGGVRGYADAAECHAKARRLNGLRHRLAAAEQRLAQARPRLALGSGRLWRTRMNLDAAGLTDGPWRECWDAARWFLTADGETGKKHGNETLRVRPDGVVEIKVPAALAPELGKRLTLAVPVSFDTHRGGEWADRVAGHRAVRYDISWDPARDRWYLDASWSYPTAPVSPLEALRVRRTLAVDLNADHLACWVIDPDGNPVGAALTVPLELAGLSAETRDAYLRHAISTLLRHARKNGCASISIENLNFADARDTGRETMGSGGRGKQFRRTVAGIPTAKFRDRLAAMAATAGLRIIAVDPAYTSKWGGRHWLKPLRKTSDAHVTGHHAAAVAIGRRAHGHRIRRKADGLRPGQRTRQDHPKPSLPVATGAHGPAPARRRRSPKPTGHATPADGPVPTPFGDRQDPPLPSIEER